MKCKQVSKYNATGALDRGEIKPAKSRKILSVVRAKIPHMNFLKTPSGHNITCNNFLHVTPVTIELFPAFSYLFDTLRKVCRS